MDNKPVRIVPTLEELCTPVAVEAFKRHKYRNSNYKLNAMLSEAIFKHTYTPNFSFDVVCSNEVRDKFVISEVELGRHNFEVHHRAMIYKQIIKKLEMFHLSESNMRINRTPDDGMDVEGRPYRVTIISGLKRFLNLESRKALQMLAISGNELVFAPGWIKEMVQLLPSIKHLDITGCYLSEDDFKALCNSGLPLEKLSLGQTNLKSIKGIRALSKLIVLSLEDVKFGYVNDLNDVIHLQNLEVLDISSNNGGALVVKGLLLCEGVPLQKLKFLDCSGNNLQAINDLLKNLINNHPSLTHISVINTAYDRNLNLDVFGKRVHFFTVADLNACSDSLMFYQANVDRSKTILARVFNFLYNEFAAQTIPNLYKCSRALVAILNNYKQDFQNHSTAIRCLHQILVADDVRPHLPLEDKISMVKAVCLATKTSEFEIQNLNSVPGYQVVIHGTDFLLKSKIMEDANLYKDVCEVLMVALSKTPQFDQRFTVQCIEFLNQHCAMIGRSDDLFPRITSNILKMLKETENITENEYPDLLDFLAFLLCTSSEEYDQMKEFVDVIFHKIPHYQAWQLAVQRSFECLELLYCKLKNDLIRLEVFSGTKLNIIAHILRCRNRSNIHFALRYLFQIHDFHNYEDKYDVTFEIVDEVVHIILNNNLHEMPTIKDIFVHIGVYSESDLVKDWVQWISKKIHE